MPERQSILPTGQIVGRLVALWRYPVKSMAGESLTTAEISWHGLAGDRRWAFIRPGQTGSGFPWLTLRQKLDLGDYHPWFTHPERPNASPTVVRAPTGDDWDVRDPALATQLGDGIQVIKQDRGVFDTAPLSIITTGSIATIGSLVGAELTPRRFRPNLLIEPAGGPAFPEDAWVGRVLQIGGAALRVDRHNQRCTVITIDPDNHTRQPAILRTVARERRNRLGVYGSTVQPGQLTVGDPVRLLPG